MNACAQDVTKRTLGQTFIGSIALAFALALLAASSALAEEAGGGAAPGAGPIVTYLGFVRADGVPLPIFDTTPEGQPVYRLAANSGFYVVVEGRPGPSQSPVGTSTLDPLGPPDLQIQVTQRLGNASAAVCDKSPPSVGGVPGTSPPDLSFSSAAAINDLACRFTNEMCVEDPAGGTRFVVASSTIQFCAFIGPELAFRTGGSLVTARLRDVDGMVGPVAQTLVLAGPNAPSATPTGTGASTLTPTASPTSTSTVSPTESPSPTPTSTPTATDSVTPSATTTETPTSSPTPTADPSPTTTRTSTPTNAPSPTATAKPGASIDLDALLHALFAPAPPSEADVNEDGRTGAADVPALLKRDAGD